MSIVEICLIDPAMAELITTHGTYAQLKQQAIANGMRSLREYGWGKVASGETTIEEVLSNVGH